MELLKINITNEGKLVGNKQERLSLVEEDGNVLDGAKLSESTKLSENSSSGKKSEGSLITSTQSYSPPST